MTRLAAVLSLLLAGPAAAALRVVTTTPDHAAIMREVAGPLAVVDSLASGRQNAHFMDPKPSHVLKAMKADLYVENGLDLEIGWSGSVLKAARNRRVMQGQPGYLDASAAVETLEKPETLSRAGGDVHPGGNPHYTQDPERAVQVAGLFARRLSELDPPNAAAYEANRAAFEARAREKLAGWTKSLAPHRGVKIVTYHRDWVYFSDRFGLVRAGEIEPKPGIPPTAQHTAALTARMKAEGVRLVLTLPWYEARTPRALADGASAKVVPVALFPGSYPGTDGYFEWMDYNVSAIAKALEGG